MGWQDSDNEDNEDIEDFDDNDVIEIVELDRFIEQTYIFSIINLRAALEPEVQQESDPEKKNKLKEDFVDHISEDDLDPDEIKELNRIYPIHKAKEIISEKIVNEDGKVFIKIIDLSSAVEQISRNMIYALFGEMQKRGDVELMWDSKNEDFVYRLAKHKIKDEKKMVAKMMKKSTKRGRKEK